MSAWRKLTAAQKSVWIVGAAAVIYAGWNYGMLEVFAVATIAAIAILILPSA